jgi:glutamate/tyrosine decarboxylase-like PLP-dependent enzyme
MPAKKRHRRINRAIPSEVAFIDPRGNNRDEARELLNQAVDLMLDHLAGAERRSPAPDLQEFPDFAAIPDEGMHKEELLKRAAFLIRQPRNLAHSGYIGNMESMPTIMSIVGAMLMAATKNNMLAEEMSPYLTRVEPEVMKWFASRFGLGPQSGGGLLAGGSLANLQALVTARNAKFHSKREGIWGRQKPPVFFASEVAHSSLQKAAMIMGLGTASVTPVRADENSRMDVTDLQHKIQHSLDSGQEPFCVVATAGTTVTGNIDPLLDIASVAKQHDLWLHTDAIYGGALAFSNRYTQRLSGIEASDSVTFNLHKWAYSATTCSMVLFKDTALLDEQFRIPAPYMNDSGRTLNLGELSLQGSRQADIIGLLLSLQHLGLLGYARLIDSRIDLARQLRTRLEGHDLVEFTGEMDTNIMCFRPKSGSSVSEVGDSRVRDLQRHLLHEADLCLTLPPYRGRIWLKADILNPFTDETQMDQLVEKVCSFQQGCRG